jgi:hypothetical protein
MNEEIDQVESLLVTEKTVGLRVLESLVATLKEQEHKAPLLAFARTDKTLATLLDGMNTEQAIVALEEIVNKTQQTIQPKLIELAEKITAAIKKMITEWAEENPEFYKLLKLHIDYFDVKHIKPNDKTIVVAKYNWNKYADGISEALPFLTNIANDCANILKKSGWQLKHIKTVKRRWFKQVEVLESVEGVYQKEIDGVTCEVKLYNYGIDHNEITISIL